MRALRLSSIGTVMFLLLGGLAHAAVAEDDEPTTPTMVTCDLSFDEETWQEAPEFIDGRVRMTYQAEADHGSSDPRLAGRATVRLNVDSLTLSGDYALTATAIVIENDDGTWHGEATGYVIDATRTENHERVELAVLRGSGAFGGLSAVLVTRSTPEDDDESCSGLIFEGTLPPVPVVE